MCWDLKKSNTKKHIGSLMWKVRARSPSSIPFLQHFPTISEQIMSALKGNLSQREKGFIVVVWIFDAAAQWLRGWGGMSRWGPLKMAGPRVTFDTASRGYVKYQQNVLRGKRTRCRAMRQCRLTTCFRLVQCVSPPPSMSEGSAFVSPLLEPNNWLKDKQE